ncbi:DUF6528 family protein [Streptomyces sp. H27-D2]|uniref:DUF6528 family protein n=1 Tax=Streptomyces sp. H27-D2 TaxID=3046304 RepID=UPI002DB8709E|nr:DUF6528 family protein [Streptomyces sp. H27-D2]MEC4020845.1 DUF6528 family protein [Streptomyces sp. H27-D2]
MNSATPARRRSFIAAAAGVLAGLGPTTTAHAAATRPRRSADALILAADQHSQKVLLLDPARPSWQSRRHLRPDDLAALWSWSPRDRPELADLLPARSWGNVSEAKKRTTGAAQQVLTCSSEGLAAVVDYPDGRVSWARSIPDANIHSLELLPGGTVAVAASTAGFVRLYPAAPAVDPRPARYAEFRLPGARGLQWDPSREALWALGDTRLVILTPGGSNRRPTLTERWRTSLPESLGHDLGTVAGDRDRLWVTTTRHVRQFSTSALRFVPYPQENKVDRRQVKSIGDDPSTGRILSVAPQRGHSCSWCTSTLDLYGPAGQHTLVGASFYKARWFAP